MAVHTIARLHEHRRWVNQGLLDAAEALSETQLHQSFSIGQGSIWRSLVHLYAAEYVWLEALQGNESPVLPGDLAEALPGNQQGEGGIRSLEELKQKWNAQEQRWIEYLDQLSAERLDDLVCKLSTSSGKGRIHQTRREDILLHVCTHAQYTTAQVVNMLRQLDVVTLPATMLITLARTQMASQTDLDQPT
ncbi:DinB family protein [Gimesia sp.]|uniref:DinB family protein n=1 Tax=Gimesia sp. TaxID=2024833 RepID=UPI003A940D07